MGTRLLISVPKSRITAAALGLVVTVAGPGTQAINNEIVVAPIIPNHSKALIMEFSY